MNMGEIIREIRIKHRLTQEQLGALLGKAGSTVRSWELGLSHPQPKTIIQLCKVLKSTPNEILGYSEQEAKICAGGCIRNYAEPLEHCDRCSFREGAGENG